MGDIIRQSTVTKAVAVMQISVHAFSIDKFLDLIVLSLPDGKRRTPLQMDISMINLGLPRWHQW